MFLGCVPPETNELDQEFSDDPRYLLDSYLASASAALPGMFGISTTHGPGDGSSMLAGTMSLAALLQQKNSMASPWSCSTPQSHDNDLGAVDSEWNMLHQGTAPRAPTLPWALQQRGACGPAAAAFALGAPTSLLLQPHPISTQPVSDRLHPNLNETGASHAMVNVNRLAHTVSQLSMLTPTSCSSRSQTTTTVDESDPSFLMPAGPCHPGWGMVGAGVNSISSEEIKDQVQAQAQLHTEQDMHFYPAQVHPVLPHTGHTHHPARVLHPDLAQCGDHYHPHRSSPALHTQRPLLPCSSSSAAVGAGAVCGSSSAHCLPSLPTTAPAVCPTSGESDPLFEQRSEPQVVSDEGPGAVFWDHSVPTHIAYPQPWPHDPRQTLCLRPGLNPTHEGEWASSAPVPPAHLMPHPSAPDMVPLLFQYENHLAPQLPPPHTPQRGQRGRGRISANPQRRRLRHQIIDAEAMLEQLLWEAAVAEEQNRGLRAWVQALEDVVVCRTEELARLELVVRGPAALAAPTATPPTGMTIRTGTISTSPKADPHDTQQLDGADTLKDMSALKEDGRRGGGRGSWMGRKAKSAPAIPGSRKAGKLQHGGGGRRGGSDDGHMSMEPRASAPQPAWDAIDHTSLEAVAAELAGPEAVKVSVAAGVAGVVALFGSLEQAACASVADVACVYGSVAQQWGAEVMAGGADGDGAAILCRAQGRRNGYVSSARGTRRGHKAQPTEVMEANSNDAAHSSAAATAPTGRDACLSLLAALPMLHALNPRALSVMGCSLVPGAVVDAHTHWHEVSLMLGLSQAQALKLGLVYQAMCSHKQQERREARAALAAKFAAWDREAQAMTENGPRGFLCRTKSDIVRASQMDQGCARLAASDWRALTLVVDVSVRVLTQQQAARLVALSYPLAPDFVGLAHAVWMATGGAQQVGLLHS